MFRLFSKKLHRDQVRGFDDLTRKKDYPAERGIKHKEKKISEKISLLSVEHGILPLLTTDDRRDIGGNDACKKIKLKELQVDTQRQKRAEHKEGKKENCEE